MTSPIITKNTQHTILAPVEEAELLDISSLKCHEEIDPNLLEVLTNDVMRNGYLRPIVVDSSTKIILDGHHRMRVAQRLHLKKIPCIMVEYASQQITVESWRPDIHVTKEDVIRRGESGELYPHKTSRHTIHGFDTATELPITILR
jgi:L-serine kinase (ADP)